MILEIKNRCLYMSSCEINLERLIEISFHVQNNDCDKLYFCDCEFGSIFSGNKEFWFLISSKILGINLDKCLFSEKNARAVFASGIHENIKFIEFREVRIGQGFFKKLMEACENVEMLILSNFDFKSDIYGDDLIKFLENNKSLRSLTLSKLDLSLNFLNRISNALKNNRTLSELNLLENKLDKFHMPFLTKIMHISAIAFFDVTQNKFTEKSTAQLARVAKEKGIRASWTIADNKHTSTVRQHRKPKQKMSRIRTPVGSSNLKIRSS